jgi:hypothetical protein
VLEYAYDQCVESGGAVRPGMERDRKKPVCYRLLPEAYM